MNLSTVIICLLCACGISNAAAFVSKSSSSSSSQAHHSHFKEQRLTTCRAQFSTAGMWNRGLNFGKGDFKFYDSFDSFMSVFPDEDKAAYPELFALPKGVYEVGLAKPLGIVFEEVQAGKGVFVQDLVEEGNAQAQGVIQPGHVLVGITATKIVGAKFERRLIPARNFDFDTVVGAIASNDERWNCYNVVMMFERPDEAESKQVDEFLEFFEPPFDNPWKQRQ
jgi:hypothetical protein